ncbi:RES family NAD+ phosphorylase [Pseudoxanthomonas sp. LARHCG66]
MDTITAFQIDTQARRDMLFRPSHAPARWSTGTYDAIYASCVASTALLEFLVHHQDALPATLIYGRLALPATCIEVPETLPDEWDEWPYRARVQRVGDDWLASSRQLALRIPSAVAPASFNLLINPRHPSYADCSLEFVEMFRADQRLRQ